MPALRGVSLEIEAGERLAIIGESGSGKSTLALAIAGLLARGARIGGAIEWAMPNLQMPHSFAPPSVLPDISPTRGEISSSVAGTSFSTSMIGESGNEKAISPLVGEMSGRTEGGAVERRPLHLGSAVPRLGRDIGFVFQDPSSSLDPVMPVGKQIAEVALTHLGLSWPQAYAHAKTLLERVRLPDPDASMRAYPHQLSGGQKQRVAIAAAIAAGPKLLIADEATSALDTIVQAEIVSLIRRLVAEDGMTLLFISHDIALAAELAERIAVFRYGELLELGTTAQIVNAPRHAYTRALLDAHLGLDAGPLRQAGAPA
ncbi:ABC transporter ATP-binding protein [Mesorhizobium sp. M4B.F.Ca.ET.215.01.1.1]|nr:ABC transporter ATP-binding protein [Mesorhizobium sp. M4B.F.Ca.ET.013.02.1.1]RUW65817.1 ABC transporter ATP-binding protein [Mesorhizobium sp. M4B.F.Ca.ET.049.02.1.2]RVC64716.1 ABC transporter ATP-binding protein [Mesorhizobium sp. M4B.F.Ca.ET.088.02.2.1]RVD38509.1 ABC transporter ATP-binding protein [Mesorhizobium sp. M4B.F.Ca.ET.019.03.1.1]RWA60024.1 MAG: ABC transporter ATP-binding protein [Mesorhizobium sp.]RWX67065.1 ATP-binding cassette domain-containing protein [Mesorhizobium sp. M4